MSEIRLVLITSLFSRPIPMPILFLLFILGTTTSSSAAAHNRRILHQPFFPQDSPPQSPPPQLPFSTSSPPPPPPPPSPFFQDFPPPPPPSSSSSSVPANISSLSLPKSPQSKHISPKLIAAALVSLLAAAALFIFIILLHICRRKAPNFSPKPQTPDNSNTNVTTLKSSKTSSEFLHLGTLLNSQPTSHINIHPLNDTLSRNLESPELRPLPPLRLSGQLNQNHQNADYSSPGTPTTRIFQEPLSFNNEIGESGSTSSSSFSSYLLAESDSGSPLKSASVSISPPASLSPKRRYMSPESLAFRTIISSLSLESSPRVSNVSSMSLSPRLSDVSSHHFCTSPTKISYFVPVAVAPPPAPLLSPTASVSTLSSPEKASSKCEVSSQTSLLELTLCSPAGTSNPLPVAITFKLNEEMNEPRSTINGTTEQAFLASTSQENRVLDPQKSQNIAILLTALHMTIEEVCEALLEGNVDKLGTELLESLLNMAPTEEEERKLKDYEDDSPFKLGPTENVFRAMLDIPFAFKRVDAMLYISNFCSAVEYLKRSFETLEAACEELRNSRMFLEVLDAVLKTGNQMNDGTNHGDAQASKLDAVLKLIDAKGAVGKTTLLHYVIHEMIEMEGARLWSANQNFDPAATDDDKYRKLGLQVVSSISSELSNVKKAAGMDSRLLNSDVLKLYEGIGIIEEIIIEISEAVGPEVNSRGFSESMNKFLNVAKEVITIIQAQENVTLSLVKEITDYFHGNSANEEAHPFRIFMVARDFLMTLDKVCEEVDINEGTIFIPANRLRMPPTPTMPPGAV